MHFFEVIRLCFFNLIQEWNEKAAEAKKEYEKAMEEYKAKKTEASDDDGDDDSSKSVRQSLHYQPTQCKH